MSPRLTTRQIGDKTKAGQKIVMTTAYDYSLAACVDESGVDLILVGDSLAQVMLGLASTREVDMGVMLHHTKAVNRAVQKALLVGDMPFGSFEAGPELAVKNARRFVEEAGCGAVKLEWFDRFPETAQAIIKAGVPVMGHIGLTPQTAESFKVQGRDAEAAARIIGQAESTERAGCFSVVLECIPDRVAGMITDQLTIPTIGIGAGPFCDGQVLVLHDILGLFPRFQPKFVKKFAELNVPVLAAVQAFRQEVEAGRFPDARHSYGITDEELAKMREALQKGER